MNSESSAQAWNTMVQGPDDDFSTFLEFNNLEIDFPPFDDNMSQQQHDLNHAQQGQAVADTEMAEGDAGMVGREQGLMPGGAGPMDINPMFQRGHRSKEDLMNLEHQARLQQQHQFYAQQAHFQRQGMVPPTPNSLEMQAGHSQFQGMNPQQARAMYEAYTRKQQEQMVFTPLVSPAVTPQDTQFARVPEYAVPGEYFSPLTSPALNAQNHRQPRSGYGSIKGSDTSEAPSPVDMDIDPGLHTPNQQAKTRSKRKAPAKPSTRAVRQSPAMKPQARKKQAGSTVIPPRDIADIMEGFTDSNHTSSPAHPGSGKLALPQSQGSSETGSISPEPLSEVLMPPPATPRPGTAGRSPSILPQEGSRSAPLKAMDNPATPASLMKLQKNSKVTSNPRMASTAAASRLDDLVIPQSVNSGKAKPDLQVDTQMEDDQVTPTLNARNGPASAPLTASTPVPPSPAFSTTTSAVASPSGRSTFKPSVKGKKRNSSSHASPALRPKISPSIKPLLPEGAKLAPDASALLVYKSNYQNILEGTHLPGVSYPEALSENLTSKRTSHKIAEQGRRNRINTALQEIARMLPQTPLSPSMLARDDAVETPPENAIKDPREGRDSKEGRDAKEGKDGKDGKDKDGKDLKVPKNGKGGKGKERSGSGGAAAANSSKANTVEMAIEYIRALQGELSEVKGRLEVAERKLGERASTGTSSSLGLGSESGGSGEVATTVEGEGQGEGEGGKDAVVAKGTE